MTETITCSVPDIGTGHCRAAIRQAIHEAGYTAADSLRPGEGVTR